MYDKKIIGEVKILFLILFRVSAGKFIYITMSFLCRTVFIRTLGTSYLGINGLFLNILSMLSLAEFGVGSAIIYKLYEPIAKDDYHRIAILMKFYKQVYHIIGLAVALIGVCLLPFEFGCFLLLLCL